MPAGLQVFDAQGNIVLDATHRIGKIIVSINTGTTNSSIVVPDLANAGQPFTYTTVDADYFAEWYAYPDIKITGTTVSWTFVDYTIPVTPYTQAPRRGVEISVGVY